MKDALIVIPAYNEQESIAAILDDVKAATDSDILVVDDGSTDGTHDILKQSKTDYVRHPVNLGLGAALETGFEYARRRGYDKVVTFDADGQHHPQDIEKMLAALEEYDFVVGVRKIEAKNMPFVKKVGNMGLNVFTKFIFNVYCRDSQSGFRALNRKALKSISLKTNRYEVSSEMLYEAKRNSLRIGEVPIRTIYTLSSISNGTTVSDGFKILWRMLLHR